VDFFIGLVLVSLSEKTLFALNSGQTIFHQEIFQRDNITNRLFGL